MGFRRVSSSPKFQVHPKGSNILSQITYSIPISNMHESRTFMYTINMLMSMSLELPFVSVLIRKKHTRGLFSLGLPRVFPWFTQRSRTLKVSLWSVGKKAWSQTRVSSQAALQGGIPRMISEAFDANMVMHPTIHLLSKVTPIRGP